MSKISQKIRVQATFSTFFLMTLFSVTAYSHGQHNSLDKLSMTQPTQGYVSSKPAKRWEHSMITGNGTVGALVPGNALNDAIALSHERLFFPENYPVEAPPTGDHLDKIREWILNGQGHKSAKLIEDIGKENEIPGMVWTDPLIPACQLHIEMQNQSEIKNYARSTNFQTAETTVGWESDAGIFQKQMFVSRADGFVVLKISSPNNTPINCRLQLAQLPHASEVEEEGEEGDEEESDESDSEENDEEEHEEDDDEGDEEEFTKEGEEDEEEEVDARIPTEQVLKATNAIAANNWLEYTTEFNKHWDHQIHGYIVAAKVTTKNGKITDGDGWLNISNANEVLLTAKVEVLDDFSPKPIQEIKRSIAKSSRSYDKLLKSHVAIHSDLFGRVKLELNGNDDDLTSEQLLAKAKPNVEKLSFQQKLFDAARYAVICSTGKIPPTLQGIWGGTWRPAWSSDFTLNGNAPTAIAYNLAGGYHEGTLVFLDHFAQFMDHYRSNAKRLFNARGIMTPSRSSDHGLNNHYDGYFPHIFWTAGTPWMAQFYYDYWQYTQDEEFLKTRALPFMLEAALFFEDFLTVEKDGKLVFVPSYSPEIGPKGSKSTATPNATMDVAAAKQLFQNLITLSKDVEIDPKRVKKWKSMLAKMPNYMIGEDGALKEWLWPGLKNDDEHRHASHLYPLWYEVDPDIKSSPELIEATKQAIENRLEYRRGRNGAEMAFGIVHLGLAAAHIQDVKRAYECVDWLTSKQYWTPGLVSYHDPDSIFNVDICGGLPGLMIEMLMMSEKGHIYLLPALPDAWSAGSIEGTAARGGFKIDLTWDKGQLKSASIKNPHGVSTKIHYNGKTYSLSAKTKSVKLGMKDFN